MFFLPTHLFCLDNSGICFYLISYMKSTGYGSKQLHFGDRGQGIFVITEEFNFFKCYGVIHNVFETLNVYSVSLLSLLEKETILFMSNSNIVHVPKIIYV